MWDAFCRRFCLVPIDKSLILKTIKSNEGELYVSIVENQFEKFSAEGKEFFLSHSKVKKFPMLLKQEIWLEGIKYLLPLCYDYTCNKRIADSTLEAIKTDEAVKTEVPKDIKVDLLVNSAALVTKTGKDK